MDLFYFILSILYGILKFLHINFIPFNWGGYPVGEWIAWAIVGLVEVIIVFALSMLLVVILVYVFRKYMADLQNRIGPNRVGPWGSLQLIADVFKLIQKQDLIPSRADRIAFKLAPYIVFTPVALGFVLIPFGNISILNLMVLNFPYTVLFLIAFMIISPLGEIIGGLSSHNKFSLYGALRSAAQDIGYEVPMMISVISVIILAGSYSANSIVYAQRNIPFIIPEVLGFFVFFFAMIAKQSIPPFDLPESGSELVSGYSTEYSGMRYGIFYMANFGFMALTSFVVATLYLGGWEGPFPFIPGLFWLLIKAAIFMVIFLLSWIALGRVRIDQFLNLGWKYLLPLSIINLLISAGLALTVGGWF
ncbi:MAG: NADH-quinone oxidoreductase subunit NuoH [Candidatus Thermoplasmatota archaeon]|jgi:NADH-quinone oxidoreductase subunit H|nr:NADH-quinone oxidoreductase subunit NuoH [Candidatus Thermoplasmatota archaeon]MCL5681353.1 NADH-quinone oxidoreductase subunit NuoH [Candidatus Thermoplasmatota archaeon]